MVAFVYAFTLTFQLQYYEQGHLERHLDSKQVLLHLPATGSPESLRQVFPS